MKHGKIILFLGIISLGIFDLNASNSNAEIKLEPKSDSAIKALEKSLSISDSLSIPKPKTTAHYDKFAKASLILGLSALAALIGLLFITAFGAALLTAAVISIFGLSFGLYARKKTSKKKWAKIGIILSSVFITGMLAFYAFVIIYILFFLDLSEF